MDSNNDYILITGAAGFIGMSLAIKFLSENNNVIGLDNENTYYDVNLKKSRLKNINLHKNSDLFTYIKGDLNSKSTWKKISKYKVKAVFHLAAQAGVRYSISNPWAYIESNILGFQNVLDYTKQNNIKDFFYASSSSVYGKSDNVPFKETHQCNQPESYYAATKISNELMAFSYQKVFGLKSIGLRFFTVYGPWGRPDMAPYLFVDSAINNKVINVFNYGKQKRDFTYIDDIVKSIFLLYINKNKLKDSLVLNIGNGSPTDLENFIEIIEKNVGKKIKKKYQSAQKGDVKITFADTSKLESIINYKPDTSIEKGLSNFVLWYKKYNKL